MKQILWTHIKRITEEELWELLETGRDDVKNNRVTDDLIKRDKTEYSSHALSEVVGGENRNYWILATRSSIDK